MARRKLEHYRYSEQAENVVQAGKPLYSEIRGRWRDLYFGNQGHLVVELACGKGEYSVGMGKLFPDKNFIGVDIKGDRIARGSRLASELELKNVAFLRAGIQYSDEFFGVGELDEIWLIHPDPQVRDRDEPKRLTNPEFLSRYASYLKPGGLFCLKTDSTFLYDYSMETIGSHEMFTISAHTNDLYNSDLMADHHDVRTHYEGIFHAKGHSIKYIKSVRK